LLQMMPSSAGTSASTASASSHIPCTAMCSIATAMLSPSKSRRPVGRVCFHVRRGRI
jgi:hypothetical protein